MIKESFHFHEAREHRKKQRLLEGYFQGQDFDEEYGLFDSPKQRGYRASFETKWDTLFDQEREDSLDSY